MNRKHLPLAFAPTLIVAQLVTLTGFPLAFASVEPVLHQVPRQNKSIQANLASDSRVQALEKKLENGKPTEGELQTLAEIISQEPDNISALLLLGLCYEKLSLPSQALLQYEKVSKLLPNDPRPLIEATKKRIHNDLPDVSALVAYAYKKFPNDAEVNYLAGCEAFKYRKIGIAMQRLTFAYQHNPKIPGLKASLAEVFYSQGDFDKAFGLARMELQTDQNNTKANMVAGLCLLEKLRYSDSVNYLARACRDLKGRTDLTMRLAIIAAWSGKYADAIEPDLWYMAGAIGAFSPNRKYCDLLVECLRRTNQKVALEKVEDVSEHYQPAAENAYYQNAVGEALDQVGWHEAAISRYRLAIKIRPRYAVPTYNLAHDLEFYAHDYQQARSLYVQAQQLGLPDNLSATDAVNRLEDRLVLQKQDIAWRLKDMLTRHPQ